MTDDRRRGGGPWRGWAAMVALASVWIVANVAWFQANRGSRLWDHEEVGYVRGVVYFGRLRRGSSMWSALHDGYTGPMQAILGAPSQWLFGSEQATVIWENIALTALTALVVFWMVRRLADPVAGLVAGSLVLLVPGMIENARGALTMVPATTFAALALAALVAGKGLTRWQWSVAGGVAIGCMSLSRTMSIAFIPGLVVPAVAWSVTAGTPRLVMVRNAALAAGAAVATSLWWWAISYGSVFDYITVGSANVATSNVLGVLASRVSELLLYLGLPTVLVAGISYPVLARRRRRDMRSAGTGTGTEAGAGAVIGDSDGRSIVERHRIDGDASSSSRPDRLDETSATSSTVVVDRHAAPLSIGPIWAAIGVDLLVSLASNTIGWLMLPVVPWIVVAVVAGVRRRFDGRSWRVWSILVVGTTAAVAIATSTVWIEPGNRFTWCMEPFQITSACRIADDAEAAPWRADIDTIVDETFAISNALKTEGREADIAVAARDHIILPSTFQLAAELRHRWEFDAYRFFPLDQSKQAQLDGVRGDADIVIVAPDVEPVLLTMDMYDPDELAGQLIGNGFASCRSVRLPDGKVVQILVREPVPLGVCD